MTYDAPDSGWAERCRAWKTRGRAPEQAVRSRSAMVSALGRPVLTVAVDGVVLFNR